ncbi:uncharacterized protein LOC108678061 [Hyalella azteca]|uniref:Uncharacterized protein LOC108678061 n=1 Tax=Hyalella azteca TaxID=294128 RepID=A0A8B7P6V5_HYAAZ|nr:uncharacterized protein LOC108678061 [Hyalella azteca]
MDPHYELYHPSEDDLDYIEGLLANFENVINENMTGLIEDLGEAINAAKNLTNGATLPTINPVNASIVSDIPSIIPANASIVSDIPTIIPLDSSIVSDIPSIIPANASIVSDIPTIIPVNASIVSEIPTIIPLNASIVSGIPSIIPVNASTIPGISTTKVTNLPTIGGFPVTGLRGKRAVSPILTPPSLNSTILPTLPTVSVQNTRANITDQSPYMEKDKAFQRLQCSFIYQYQTKLEEQTKKNFTFATDVGTVDHSISELVKSVGDMRFCTNFEAWKNKSVTIRYNLVCRKEVYEDLLGNYTEINRAYNETYINCTHVAVSCVSGVYDLRNLWQPAKEINMTDQRVKALVNRSRTYDLSDLRGRFAPDRDVVEKTARKREDFVQVCSIDNVHCNYKQFYPYTTKDVGVCYTFNSPHLVLESSPNVSIDDRRKNFKPRTSFKTGPQSGLSLTLNLHAASYLSLLSPWSGLRVVLHEPWQAPFPADEGFNLAAGLSHSIAVTKTVMSRVGPPYGQCADTSSKMFDYSEALCNKLCIEREFRRRCNCTVNEGPAFDSLGEEDEFKAKKFGNCDAFDRFQGLCMQAVNYESTTEVLNCNCDPACKEVRYSALISSTDVNREFLKIVQNIKQVPMGGDLCGEWNSTVRLQIYIDSFSFEEIDESPAYTWATLIANLGGNLGFVGVSLITFFDVVYYLFDVFLILVWPRCYDVSEGVTKSVAPVKKIPKKIIILAGPPEQLPHGQPSKKRPLRSKDRWTDRFNQVFMSE